MNLWPAPQPGTGSLLSWKEMLTAVPHRNASASVAEETDGTVAVTVRLNRPAWLVPPVSWVLKPAATRTVRLDAVGTAVWHSCDGTKTVEAVVEAFAALYRLSFHEARAAVTEFLKSLVQRGVLVMEMNADLP